MDLASKNLLLLRPCLFASTVHTATLYSSHIPQLVMTALTLTLYYELAPLRYFVSTSELQYALV